MTTPSPRDPMRFAYADPPYPRQSNARYGAGAQRRTHGAHPDYEGEVDHPALIAQLVDEYPDGWALSTNPGELRWLLPLVPEKHRVLAWVKPFAAWKRNHWPVYAWEPVILVGGRSLYGTQETPRDFISEPITMRKGVSGAKPLAFCLWLFSCLGATPDDTVDDLFPGSGAVGHAWMTYCAQVPLAFPAEPETQPMFTEEAA